MENKRKKKEEEERRKMEEAARSKKKRKKTGTPGRKVEEVVVVDKDQKHREVMKKMMSSWKTRNCEEDVRNTVTNDDVFEESRTVDDEPVVVVKAETKTEPRTRPSFRAALRMFSSSKEVKRDSYETWKEEKQAQVDRKRKKEQEEMDVEQNNIAAGKSKALRMDLSSSGILQQKHNFKI